MKSKATPTIKELARLRRDLHAAGVAQKTIAERLNLTKWHVCHVLAGKATSARVLATAQTLLAEATRTMQSPNGSVAPTRVPAGVSEELRAKALEYRRMGEELERLADDRDKRGGLA